MTDTLPTPKGSLRDAIASALRDDGVDGQMFGPPPERFALAADDVLATPEMQGLRDALRALDEYGGPNYLEYLDVPGAVLAWVRGGTE